MSLSRSSYRIPRTMTPRSIRHLSVDDTSVSREDVSSDGPMVEKQDTSSKFEDISVDDDTIKPQATPNGSPSVTKARYPGDGSTHKGKNTPSNDPEEICLIEYLFKRMHQIGVRSIFGVPGDYNLMALDYVQACGLRWIGNANELNAGYAADGYARIKGISALMTVMGVGELSAINAIAGLYIEKAPIVHIVGMPSTTSQRLRHNLHHSLGNGNLIHFPIFPGR